MSHLGRVSWTLEHCYQLFAGTFSDAEVVPLRLSPVDKKHVVGGSIGGDLHFGAVAQELVNRLVAFVEVLGGVVSGSAELVKRALDASLGKDCILETTVDSRIIGGVVAVVGDRVVDGSLRTALDDLGKDLIGTPLQ